VRRNISRVGPRFNSGRRSFQSLGRRGPRTGCLDFRLPGIVTTRVKMQCHRRSIELGLDFVFDFLGRYEYAAKIAGNTTPFAAPEADRHCPAECRYRQARCARRLLAGLVRSAEAGPFIGIPCSLAIAVAADVLSTMRPGSRGGKYCHACGVSAATAGTANKQYRAKGRGEIGYSLPALELSVIFRSALVRNIIKVSGAAPGGCQFWGGVARQISQARWRIGDSP
jgi:hypothetical protein